MRGQSVAFQICFSVIIKFFFIIIKLCRKKEFTFGPLDIEDEMIDKPIRKKEKLHIKIGKILQARDVTPVQLDKLIKNKNENRATEEEKIIIERNMLRITWGIEEISQEFLKCFYQKDYILKNLKALIDIKDIDEEDPIKIAEMKLKCKIIHELISMLGFSCNTVGKTVISKEDLETNIQQILQKSMLFKDFNKNRMLFGLEKVKSSSFKKWTSKIFLNMVNSLLNRFGIKIKCKKKSIRVDKSFSYEFTYSLQFIHNINEFIDTEN